MEDRGTAGTMKEEVRIDYWTWPRIPGDGEPDGTEIHVKWYEADGTEITDPARIEQVERQQRKEAERWPITAH